MTTIAARIAHARQTKNLNQSELARMLMVSPQAVQSWESGKSQPKGLRIEALAKALGVSTYYLLTGNIDIDHVRPASLSVAKRPLKDVLSVTQTVSNSVERFSSSLKDSMIDMDFLGRISDPSLLIAIFYITAAAAEGGLEPSEVEMLKKIADRIKDTPVSWEGMDPA